MKVKLQASLTTSQIDVKWMEEGQLIFQAGNSICIRDVLKNTQDFVQLHKGLNKLYSFAVSPNCKYIFTAQSSNAGIEICSYNMNGERKQFKISESGSFIPAHLISSIDLLPDEFDSSIIYGVAKNKTQACLFLIDMVKLKIISIGFVNAFDHIIVNSNDTYAVSISGKTFIKYLRAQDGLWTVEEKLPKKLQNIDLVSHEIINGGRILIVTTYHLYILEDNEFIQSVELSNGENYVEKVVNINNKMFFVFMSGVHLKIFRIQGEKEELVLLEERDLNLPQKSDIKAVALSRHQEQILLHFQTGELYHLRIQEIIENIKEQINLDFSPLLYPYIPKENLLFSLSTNKNICLFSDGKQVTLWDLTRNCSIISVNFYGKEIKALAINPDGHSFCLAFSDKIRFYRILMSKFQQFGEIMIKKCHLIHYCHGGQFVACGSGRGSSSLLTIVNTLMMYEIHSFKMSSQALHVIFNEHDDEVYVANELKTISLYKISSQSKLQDFNFKEDIKFMRFDNLSKKVLASVGKQIQVIDQSKNVSVVEPRFPKFQYVYPTQGVYLGVDSTGGLYYSTTMNFEKHFFLQVFPQKSFILRYRRGTLVAQSGPEILNLKLKTEKQAKKDEQNIVLVEIQEVDRVFEKVKLLESQFETYQSKTLQKIEEEKRRYDENLNLNSEKFEKQIGFIQKRLYQLQSEKVRQEKDNGRVFDELEEGQIKNLNDIERMYDLKIKLQKEKYLTLEQETLQQKMKYEKMISELQKKYHTDVEAVRKDYMSQMNEEIKKNQERKSHELQYKKKMELKLINIEEEGELTLFQLQKTNDNTIKGLVEKNAKLTRENDSIQVAQHSMTQDMKELKKKLEESVEKLKKSEKAMQESSSIVSVLEKEIHKKDDIIEEKNATIKQQAHQIDGLQKAKYVLGFRRVEIRKQLEPKESFIEKLKSELLKLDEEFRAETKKNFELSQKIEKLQKAIMVTKKENGQIKGNLKQKEKAYDDLCEDIYKIIKNIFDLKKRNAAFVQLYQNYISDDKMKKKIQQKNDNTSEEINRHLIHVEQSLQQVATGNEKILKGKEKEVFRKMKENAELVYDLNVMRKKENGYLSEIKEKDHEISRLKREINETTQHHKSTRANTANTGTRKVISRQVGSHNQDILDLSVRRQSDYLIPEKSRKGRIMSAHKTMVWREESRKQRTKISDLARQLESAKNTIKRQDRMIEELNQRLLGMPDENFV